MNDKRKLKLLSALRDYEDGPNIYVNAEDAKRAIEKGLISEQFQLTDEGRHALKELKANNKEDESEKKKPAGSGWAALALSAALIFSAVYVYLSKRELKDLGDKTLFSVWLIVAALATGVWGWQRIYLPAKDPAKVGQPTLIFLLSFVSISIALLALLTD